MASLIPHKLIDELLRTTYKVNREDPILQLDELFRKLDITTLNRLYAEATAQIELGQFFLQHGMSIAMSGSLALIAGGLAVYRGSFLWLASILVVTILVVVISLAARDKKRSLAHLLIRESIARQIADKK